MRTEPQGLPLPLVLRQQADLVQAATQCNMQHLQELLSFRGTPQPHLDQVLTAALTAEVVEAAKAQRASALCGAAAGQGCQAGAARVDRAAASSHQFPLAECPR